MAERLATVGTGMIADIVMPHLEEWGFSVDAVCGTPRSEEKVRALAEEHHATPYTDFARMLAETAAPTVYVAVPNHLHYDFCKQALEAGKHVLLEKPFASNAREVEELMELARSRDLLVYEAITTIHQPNMHLIQDELLQRIGDVRIVSVNYSQYSHRFDAFREGTVLPVFDPAKSGGALMDIGFYGATWICDLFGQPKGVAYAANVERGIDLSGVLTLDYGGFKAVSVGAKDCAAPCHCIVQGTRGYIAQDTPPGACGPVTLHLNDGTEETFDRNPENRWEPEFRFFAQALATGDRATCYALLEKSLVVARVMTEARLSAGVRFPADDR